ncbi:MAG: glycosyltransferase family 4 protein [Thermoanaerobaculia bacterium]
MGKRALFLFTEVYSSFGGIQNASKQLMKVFAALDFDETALILNDDKAPAEDCPAEVSFYRRSKFRFVAAALRRARKTRADWIVLGHANFAPLVPLLKLVSRSKIAVVLHGIEVWTRRNLLVRIGLRMSDALTAPSRYTRDQFCATNGFAPERVDVVPWFTDTPEVAPHDGGGDGIIAVTRLSRGDVYKGVGELLRALALLQTRGLTVPATIVGDGELRPQYETEARDLGLVQVRFTGSVSDEALELLMRSSDMFVLPSTKEGFGIVYLEAMRFAKPVICTAVGGQVDIVEHGKTGIVVPPGDVTALSDAIATLWLDASKRQQFGSSGNARLRSVFSFGSIQTFWHDVLARRAA